MRIEFDDAAGIQLDERDFKLGLNCQAWPKEASPHPRNWLRDRSDGRWFSRILGQDAQEEKNRRKDDRRGGAGEKRAEKPIRETILRFPSAPIHGLHRLHEYHVNEGESENFHTYRVFSHPKRIRRTKVRRIFLMHNGLNETQSMALYHRLASYLIHQDEEMGTVCLLRPFPGHLTRSRFAGFAETPLDHYLWDGSHLFRQFLRYMIETQWLLSAIARRSTYRCISGLNLLAEHVDPDQSRLDDEILAREMWKCWMALYRASRKAIRGLHSDQGNATGLREHPDEKSFVDVVSSLRENLNLTARLDGELREVDEPEPTIHVVGYSLGGFTAQSVFMSWPFFVSSCATLLSGGALRELAPTAFANPEEWQTVLHSLRYELDDAMLSDRYQLESRLSRRGSGKAATRGKIERGRVSGIEFDLFLFLKSTFYEVFQQEYKGSFQTRLASFRQRMRFIVGGNDPIVRPRKVLDSGPPDGINMFAIGGLGHFLAGKSRNDEEEQQRSFWLPEMAKLIDTLADEAGVKLEAERAENWLDAKMRIPTRPNGIALRMGGGRLNAQERMSVDGEGTLPAPLFQRCLDDLLSRADARRGILFILRNEVPTVLLDNATIQQLAAGLHHDDAGIAGYFAGLKRRKELILANPDRVSLILPWNTQAIMENMDAHPGHPSQSEGAGGQIPKRAEPNDTWKKFQDTCTELCEQSPHAVRICDGRRGVHETSGLPALNTSSLAAAALSSLRVTDTNHPVTPSLPDCWVWMSPEFLALDMDEMLTVEVGRERLCKIVPEEYGDEDVLSSRLRRDQLRIVTVSRSRYNPRFRGRIVVDPHAAKTLLLHITLCIAVSVPFGAFDFERCEVKGMTPASIPPRRPR